MRNNQLASLVAILFATFLVADSPSEGQTVKRRAGALVIVDASSPDYDEFRLLVEPFLKNFGVPYAILDASSAPLPSEDYALYILGHGRLALGAGLNGVLAVAYARGAGLVSFDSTPEPGGWFARHFPLGTPYLIDHSPSLEVFFPETGSTSDYITALHSSEAECSSTAGCPYPTEVGPIRVAPWLAPSPPQDVATLAVILEDPGPPSPGGERLPLLAALDGWPDAGRAVQWGSIDWITLDGKGPVGGHPDHRGTLDDLVWRSLSWTAQKPFAMKLLPPLLTARIDHVRGFGVVVPEPHTFEPYVDSFVKAGFKPFLSVMIGADGTGLEHIDCPEEYTFDFLEKDRLGQLARNGLVTVSAHQLCKIPGGGDYGFFHPTPNDSPVYDSTVLFDPAEMDARFAFMDLFHDDPSIPGVEIPQSPVVVPHRSEIGVYGFPGLAERGIEFVALSRQPIGPMDQSYNWPAHGPYRKEPPPRNWVNPKYSVYYADEFTISDDGQGGYPAFSENFFSCNSEMRGLPNGTDWKSSCPGQGCGEYRGIEYLRRALDSRVMASLFTHDVSLEYSQVVLGRDLLAQLETIVEAVDDHNPWFMTLDDACVYTRAHHGLTVGGASYTSIGAEGSLEKILLEDGQEGLHRLELALQGQSGRSLIVEVFGEGDEGSTVELPDFDSSDVSAADSTVNVFRAEDGSPVIDCWDDDHQHPNHDPKESLVELDIVGSWDEFDWVGRDFPIVVTEADQGLVISDDDTIQFSGRVANGHYRVIAGLYHSPKTELRYGYSYQPDDDTTSLSATAPLTSVAGFREIALEPLTVVDGTFELEARTVEADAKSHAAWAYIRLVPQIDAWKDSNQKPGHPTTFGADSLNAQDHYWDEFHGAGRSYPGLFANLGERGRNTCLSPPLSQLETLEIRKNVANGCYAVVANLYSKFELQYYYGYASDPLDKQVDVDSNLPQGQLSDPTGNNKWFREVELADVLVTEGQFRLRTNCATPLGSTPPNRNFGWSWIRLEPKPGGCQ